MSSSFRSTSAQQIPLDKPDVLATRRRKCKPMDGLCRNDFGFSNRIQCLFQPRHGSVYILELVKAEQAQPEGLEAVRLATGQRHAGGDLHILADKAATAMDTVVFGVADDHAGCAETIRRDAGKAPARQQCPHPVTE